MTGRQAALLCVIVLVARVGAAADMVQLDPFAQATRGFAGCKAPAPPLFTPEQAQHEAHVRVERGTRCAEAGECEPGGAYKRDGEINARIVGLIAADASFADTSVWVTTSRRWVTLRGCVRSAAQRRALVRLVSDQRSVERVFDELAPGGR